MDLKYYRDYKGKSHVLVATVKNLEIEKIAFVRYFDQLGPFLWNLEINGPGGNYDPYNHLPGPVLPIQPSDFIIIKPGESYTMVFHICSAYRGGYGNRDKNNVGSTPGQYEASISYSFSESVFWYRNIHDGPDKTTLVEKWEKLIKEVYFVQSMSSRPVDFNVTIKTLAGI